MTQNDPKWQAVGGAAMSCRHRHPPGGANDPGAAGAWVWVRQRGAWVGPRRAGARDNERSTNAYGKDGFAPQGCEGPIDCVLAIRFQTFKAIPCQSGIAWPGMGRPTR